MIVKACNRGHSFKGVLAYVFDQGTPEEQKRYGFTHALNMSSQNRKDFAIDMITTERNAEALKQAQGIPLTGNKISKGGVYHFILSWDETETPSPEHQKAAAIEAIGKLGLAEHQAVITNHQDTKNPHVHIVVNLTHPKTGLRASVQRDYKKLANWARDYEREHGIKCEKRRNRTIERGTKPAKTYDPAQVLERIESRHAAFTRQNMERELYKSIPDKAKRGEVIEKVLEQSRIMQIGEKDGKPVYTTQKMIDLEKSVIATAQHMQSNTTHNVHNRHKIEAIAAFNTQLAKDANGAQLTEQQREAIEKITSGEQLSNMIGVAGAGKSTVLSVAREAWEKQGFKVRGLALSGIAAEGLKDAGFKAETLHALEARARLADEITTQSAGRALSEKQAALVLDATITANDILVIDEAGMVGADQSNRVMQMAKQAGAKVVLSGDYQQLQSIEAGKAFEQIVKQTPAENVAEITEIRRQREEWAREATTQLAKGDISQGLSAYEQRGHIKHTDSHESAQAQLVADYMRDFDQNKDTSRLALAYTRADVAEINTQIRAAMIERGIVGKAQTTTETIETDTEGKETKKSIDFAQGDKIMFRENNKALGVMNGSIGTIESIHGNMFNVVLDNGREVEFDVTEYKKFALGYCATIHKTQGVTVDNTFIQASKHYDRHAAYVAMSRHRDNATLYASQDDFKSKSALFRTLSRDSDRLSTLDFSITQERAETQQGERMSQPKQKRQEGDRENISDIVTREFKASQNGVGYVRALENHGLKLAPKSRGGGFVVVDEVGKIHSMARLLKVEERGAAKTKAIQAKTKDIDRASLGNAEEIAASRKIDRHMGDTPKEKADSLQVATQFENAAPAYKPDYDAQAKTRAQPRKDAKAKDLKGNFNKNAPRVAPVVSKDRKQVAPERANDNLDPAQQRKQQESMQNGTENRAKNNQRLSPQEMHELHSGMDTQGQGGRARDNEHILLSRSSGDKQKHDVLQSVQPSNSGRGTLATAKEPSPKLEPAPPPRKRTEKEELERIMREQARIKALGGAIEKHKREQANKEQKEQDKFDKSIHRANQHVKALQSKEQGAKRARGIKYYEFQYQKEREKLQRTNNPIGRKLGQYDKAFERFSQARNNLKSQRELFGQDINAIYKDESRQERNAALNREGFGIVKEQEQTPQYQRSQEREEHRERPTLTPRRDFTSKSEKSRGETETTQSNSHTHSVEREP